MRAEELISRYLYRKERRVRTVKERAFQARV
jgi:hypothetical protein